MRNYGSTSATGTVSASIWEWGGLQFRAAFGLRCAIWTAPAIYGQNRGVRRTLLWSLLAVVAAVYLPVAVWGVSAGLDDASNLIWAFVIVPSFVGAGVILMVKRPGHPIGELLLACGIALWGIPTILEIATQVIFRALRSPGLDVGGDVAVPDPHLCGCRALRHPAGSPPRRPISVCRGSDASCCPSGWSSPCPP